MDSSAESEASWGGDSNAEWMSLAVETAGIGTWEFDLEAGDGFYLRALFGDNGIPKDFPKVDSFEDWLSMMHQEDRRRVLSSL